MNGQSYAAGGSGVQPWPQLLQMKEGGSQLRAFTGKTCDESHCGQRSDFLSVELAMKIHTVPRSREPRCRDL